jgi:prepilin-type N-terminal cleavage/methylation domain-containing protein
MAPAPAQPPSSLARRPAGAGGFTLIEVLVAATITALLAGFIVAIVANVSEFWSRSTGRLSTDAQARLVLDQLTLDLSSAVYRDDGNVWMAINVLNNATGNATGLWQTAAANAKPVGGVSLAMNSANLIDTRYGTAGVWLRFFTTKRGANTATDTTTFSAPVAVGYQIIRRFTGTSSASTRTAYLFHRAEARPAATVAASGAAARPGVMESGYNITAAAYTTSTAATNNGGTTGDPRSIQVPGSRTNLSSVIADNVVDFGVRCYVRDATQPTGLRVVFPAANAKGTLSNATTVVLRGQFPSTTAADSSNYNFVFPDVVDVMIRVLTDEGARLIATYETAGNTLAVPSGLTAQQYWWQIATANSQVFTRRIVLNAQPL